MRHEINDQFYAPMFHARIRALERVSGVCPGVLVRGIQWAIKSNRRDLLHFVRWQGDDRTVWHGTAANGKNFTAVANPTTGAVITIMAGWVGHHLPTHDRAQCRN